MGPCSVEAGGLALQSSCHAGLWREPVSSGSGRHLPLLGGQLTANMTWQYKELASVGGTKWVGRYESGRDDALWFKMETEGTD